MLSDLRLKIDKLDDELLRLINERMSLAKEIARIKEQNSLAYFVPTREEEILKRLLANNKGPLNQAGVESIFAELFALMRNLENTQTLACVGMDALLLARKLYGGLARYDFEDEYYKAFGSLKEGRVKYVVVALKACDDLLFTLNYFKPFLFARFECKNTSFAIFSKHKNIDENATKKAYLLANNLQFLDIFMDEDKYLCLRGKDFSYLEAPFGEEIDGLWLGSFQIFKKC